MSNKILLITRLSTQNAGNEGLSIELINLVKSILPAAEIRAMDRYPPYFSQFHIPILGSDMKKVLSNFEELSNDLARKFRGKSDELVDIANEGQVKLDKTAKELTGWIRKVKRRIAIRKRLAALGLIGKAGAAKAINSCLWADLVIWNPAGEIHHPSKFSQANGDEVLRLLLLIRIAQLNGARTMIINHSLEIGDPALRIILKHVYEAAEQISVRDKKSRMEALSLGLEPTKVHEIPDMVYLAAEDPAGVIPSPEECFKPGSICFAINGRKAYGMEAEWDALFEGAKKFGRPITFLSNAMHHDVPFVKGLAQKHDIQVISRQPTYREIQGFYNHIDILVGSRLHSNVLALCAGVPVVSLEASIFKMTGVFEQLEYPIPTSNMKDIGWHKVVLQKIESALNERDQLSMLSKKVTLKQADRIRQSYASLLAGKPQFYVGESAVTYANIDA